MLRLGGTIKKLDMIIIVSIFLFGIISLIGINLYASSQETGYTYAKITYKDELILMIDLDSLEYVVYDTDYKNLIYVDLASEGIFYVPGTVTTDMTNLYLIDSYAQSNNIQGIKLFVEDGYIQVAYQESPQDICELQNPTNSSLQPLVCLPNELVINIYTNLSGDQFIPDSVLE